VGNDLALQAFTIASIAPTPDRGETSETCHNLSAMNATIRADLYRKLPSVDELIRSAEIAALVERGGHFAVAEAVRSVLSELRQEITAGTLDLPGIQLAVAGLADAVARRLRESLVFSLRPVINATGVILHTNFGRAPLSSAALQHATETATGYSNLEFDLDSGQRGRRDIHVDHLFRNLLAEDSDERSTATPPPGSLDDNSRPAQISTIVVNNNAAAVLLALNTLAEDGEVIVSRGELVEIGGSFRIPDVMSKSNAILREVGTTNRTRISDYEKAINDRTRLLLRVHRSNFQITGFTEQPSLAELVQLGQAHKIPVLEDLGSGALFDLRAVGLKEEPSVLDSLHAGVDVVTYSGDKLLGGPQAGLLSGKQEFMARIRSNPLFRALRVDKLIYAALEATLLAYVKHDHDSIPAIRMMRLSKAEIGQRAESLAEAVRSKRLVAEIVDGESVVGGGAAPSSILPTRLLAIRCEGCSANELESHLRSSDPPIIARVEEGRVLLDLRTVFPQQDETVVAALKSASTSGA